MLSTPQETARLTAEPGTRLAELHARYADAKAEASEAADRLKACVDALKVELAQAAPGATDISLSGEGGAPLRMAWTETWRFDSKRFKAENPVEYVRYATKSGTWVLRADNRAVAE